MSRSDIIDLVSLHVSVGAKRSLPWSWKIQKEPGKTQKDDKATYPDKVAQPDFRQFKWITCCFVPITHIHKFFLVYTIPWLGKLQWICHCALHILYFVHWNENVASQHNYAKHSRNTRPWQTSYQVPIFYQLAMTQSAGLTHWGWVTHICVGKLTDIGSDNGLSPWQRQAIIWTNAEILLIGPLETNFSEISIESITFSFKKMHLKMLSGKWWPFRLGLNVLNGNNFLEIRSRWICILTSTFSMRAYYWLQSQFVY